MLQSLDGDIQLLFKVDKHLQEQAKNAVLTASERLKQGKEMTLSVEQTKHRRSLDANSYFHVLCSKIAQKSLLSMDEVKRELVVNYGSPLYSVIIPSGSDISALWAYWRFIGQVNGKSEYWLYKQTHTLNTSEMSQLIKGAVQEAQQLGIQTLTPRELAEIEKKWEESNAKFSKA